jgi:hypothetical protein
MERYGLYGLVPQEHEANERAMTLDEQNIGDSGVLLVYETSNATEARAIYEAGGFMKDGKWFVVTRVEDRLKRSSTQHSTVPRKTDYDQR